jgi:toxin ParE1/3/4
MSLPVVLRPEASRDADEARGYFDGQRTGLGQVFLDRLNEAVARIGAMPEMYGVVWQNVRAARLTSSSTSSTTGSTMIASRSWR